jgi:hypothetical protein
MKKLVENIVFQYCLLIVFILVVGWAIIVGIHREANSAKNNEKVHWSDKVEPVHNYKNEVISNIRIGYMKNGDVIWREEFIKFPMGNSILEIGSNMKFVK